MTATMARNGAKYISLPLLCLPALYIILRLLTSFPMPPQPVKVYPSLASLPPDSRSWKIYPENFYEGGHYVDFPFGKVRYWLFGPEAGEKIVLIHGLSVPSMIWKDVAPQLATRGFRVLVYDLYGRGYSDAPNLPYNASLYTTQLALLMQHIRWEKAHVAAVSMGGGIATSFAASFPHLTTGKIALVASTGLMEAEDFSRTSKVMSSPIVQYVSSTAPVRVLLKKLLSGNPTPNENPLHEIVQIQSAQLPGYNRALASSLRNGPLRGLSSAFSSLSRQNQDVFLIWGTNDQSVPYRYAAQIQELVPNSHLLTVENGTHDLTVSHPDIICDTFDSFFRSRK